MRVIGECDGTHESHKDIREVYNIEHGSHFLRLISPPLALCLPVYSLACYFSSWHHHQFVCVCVYRLKDGRKVLSSKESWWWWCDHFSWHYSQGLLRYLPRLIWQITKEQGRSHGNVNNDEHFMGKWRRERVVWTLSLLLSLSDT